MHLFRITNSEQLLHLVLLYIETSLIWPPYKPTSSGLISKVALLLKTLLMQPFNKLESFNKLTTKKAIVELYQALLQRVK